jgi:hypothetical protein
MIGYGFFANKDLIIITDEARLKIKASSFLNQLVLHFSRTEIAHLVAKHQAENHSKGFTC